MCEEKRRCSRWLHAGWCWRGLVRTNRRVFPGVVHTSMCVSRAQDTCACGDQSPRVSWCIVCQLGRQTIQVNGHQKRMQPAWLSLLWSFTCASTYKEKARPCAVCARATRHVHMHVDRHIQWLARGTITRFRDSHRTRCVRKGPPLRQSNHHFEALHPPQVRALGPDIYVCIHEFVNVYSCLCLYSIRDKGRAYFCATGNIRRKVLLFNDICQWHTKNIVLTHFMIYEERDEASHLSTYVHMYVHSYIYLHTLMHVISLVFQTLNWSL